MGPSVPFGITGNTSILFVNFSVTIKKSPLELNASELAPELEVVRNVREPAIGFKLPSSTLKPTTLLLPAKLTT